jgi:Carboxypeptidase regulatory-like domain
MSDRIWFLTALLVASLYAQTITTGEVTGTVVDVSGAMLTSATVLLKSVDTGETRAVQSNIAGVYRFALVKPGTYELSGASAGLRSDRGRLIVAVGQVQVMDLSLKLEEAEQVVLVTDATPLLNTDNANSTYAVSTRQLELLPLPGGDLVGVAYSMPGVVINNRKGTGNFASPGVGSISNLFTVNGVDDMDPYFGVNNSGTSGLLLGANEIREVSIVQNAYDGQYGRQAGTQVNYVSKSGTNAFHGNLLHQYNGTVMNANDFFNNRLGVPRPHAVSNQYAAAIGGRLVRDKAFFFADTEGLRFAVPVTATIVAIPSQAMQNYSLSAIQPSQRPLYRKMFELYSNAPGHEHAVAVTNGTGSLQDSTGRLGCGALAGRLSGSGGVFGTNVSCAQAWGANVSRQNSEWLLSTRVDYNVHARQRLFLRFKTDHGFLTANASAIDSAFNTVSVQPDYEGQLNHTFVITPRLVNNFIGSANYNDYAFAPADLAASLKLFPFRFNIFDGGANGSGGMTAMGAVPAYPQGRRAGQLQIVDDISYSTGRHSLKAGVNYRYHREADLGYSALTYIGRFTFLGLDELAGGALNALSGSNYFQNFIAASVLHLHLYHAGIYIQDQWSFTPHLKVTATLRFDRNGNPDCLDHCFARLTSPFPGLSKGVSIPYNQSIQTGLEHAFYEVEPFVAQPRVSMVFKPGWGNETVFRAGIGLFSDLYPEFFASKMAGNAPNVFTSVIQTGLVDASGTGSAPAIALASARAFTSQFAQGATMAQLQGAVVPASFTPPGYYSVPSIVRSPKYLKWSFDIQRPFGARNVFTIRYAGNHGYDIFLVNPNGNANANPALYPNGFGGLPANVPDGRFRFISQLTNSGYSNYNGLTAMFRRSLGYGFQGQIGYTWSHALDTLSNGGLVAFGYDSSSGQIDPNNVRSLNYSSADYDARHNLVGDFVWEIPAKFKSRVMDRMFVGWSIAAKLSAHSGTPFSVFNNRIASRVSSSYGGNVLAHVLDPQIRTNCGASTIDKPCFTAGQFATMVTQNDPGNWPRNSFRGPGFFNVDTSLYKTISAGERMRLMFGASAYNLLNNANFGGPGTDVAASALGLITFTLPSPSGPYGSGGGPSGRALVITAKFAF